MKENRGEAEAKEKKIMARGDFRDKLFLAF